MNASPLTRGRSLLFSDNVPAKLSRRCRQKAEGKPWCWWIRAPCWAAAWWSPPSKQFRTFSAGSRIKFAFLSGFERLQAEPDPGSWQKEWNLFAMWDSAWIPTPKAWSTNPFAALSQDAVITQSCCWWVGSEDADTEFSRAGNSQSSSRPPKVTQKIRLGLNTQCALYSPWTGNTARMIPALILVDLFVLDGHIQRNDNTGKY